VCDRLPHHAAPIARADRLLGLYDVQMSQSVPRFHTLISYLPSLPHPALPRADWADCYSLRVKTTGRLQAADVAHLALDRFPPWARFLLWLRNAIVAPFGLQSTRDVASNHTEVIGFFPIISQSDGQIVVGLDDSHLDFRLVIDVLDLGAGEALVSFTTLVYRKVLLGRIYIAAITPFHRLIVKASLRQVGRCLEAKRR
jgi:hypothetical protein